jgi:hypothetical protein
MLKMELLPEPTYSCFLGATRTAAPPDWLQRVFCVWQWCQHAHCVCSAALESLSRAYEKLLSNRAGPSCKTCLSRCGASEVGPCSMLPVNFRRSLLHAGYHDYYTSIYRAAESLLDTLLHKCKVSALRKGAPSLAPPDAIGRSGSQASGVDSESWHRQPSYTYASHLAGCS